jgi:O-antigen ligase
MNGFLPWLAQFSRKLARLSLAATIATIPLRYRLVVLERDFPPIYRDYTDILLFASDWFFLATLAFWLVSLGLQRRSLRRGPFFLTYPILGMTAVGLISIPGSADPLLSGVHALRLILLAGFYLYIVNEVESLQELALPVSIMILSQAVVGIGQSLGQGDLGLQAIGEYELDPAWNGVSIVWVEGIRSLRAYGLSDHPNILGGCLAFALILMLAWQGLRKPFVQLVAVAIFALGMLGLFLTFSRSAWLALAVAVILIVTLQWKGHQSALNHSLGLVTAGLIIMFPFLISHWDLVGVRLNRGGSFSGLTPEAQSIGSRELLNRAANEIFVAHPLTGVGLGAFPVALSRMYPEFPIDYQPAHVVLLDVAAEIGIFGASLYALAITAPWLAIWINRRRLVVSPAFITVTGLNLAVTIIGFFDYYTWLLVPGRLWQWLAWGLWGLTYQAATRESDHA